MHKKPSIILLLVFCFALGFAGLCTGEDQETALTVKKIAFTRDKGGRERVALSCNQPCLPEVFSLEGEKPRVVLDMKGVSHIETKSRTVHTGGKSVKRVRNYLDKQTNILKVVLDMEPSQYYIVRPRQDPSTHTYVLMIDKVAPSAGRKAARIKDAQVPPLSGKKHITILHPELRPAVLKPAVQASKLPEAAPSPENSSPLQAAKNTQSLDQGRSQLHAGEFAAAADTFTQVLAAHPQDSLSYRLRGNAYDNLGNRQQAVADWTQAARLGDTILQSYLDFLQVNWRGTQSL